MYDVVIIGGGVIGAMTARTLSKYDVKICVLEKENDVAMGATKANSAIVHAGFDAKCGSLKAKFNVEGSKMMEKIANELHVKYKRNGSLVLAFSKTEMETINELYKRGVKNGVEDLEVITKDRLLELEPKASKEAIGALYAPTGAIVCPYELTIAAMGNAMDNGADLKCNFEVISIELTDGVYTVTSKNGDTVTSKYIVNAAGVFADKIAKMVGDNSFEIHPRRGEYILLDKECGNIVTHTIFQAPSKMGKGILVSPTVDGNMLAGPTSEDIEDKNDTKTTAEGLKKVMAGTLKSVPDLRFNKSITSFCGLRAVGDTEDFIINSPVYNFINVAGIESPGLSSAPAISEYVKDMLSDLGLVLKEKADFSPYRKSPHFFKEMSMDEKNKLIAKDPRYGHIICRCETVTEGEIVYAIHQNPRPTDLDGIKRRTRAQMGRCQGGFCSPLIVELLSKELNIPYEDVTKSGGRSFVNVGKTKGEVEYD